MAEDKPKEKEAVERREISMEEVEKHNTEEDCWVVMHDFVLNLPKEFLDEHPGGPDVITGFAGKEATRDFEDIAHSDFAREWSNKYIIGWKEGAREEAKDPKALIPTKSEVDSAGGGGGNLAIAIPAVIVVILAVVGYFVMQKSG